ncbi:alpha/beta fold hydrolase [Streptomyces sp. NPDC054901]
MSPVPPPLGPGPTAPPVVLVAAAGTAASTWAPLLPALTARTRVIAHDRPGLGTRPPAPGPTLAGSVADLAALLDSAGPGPYVLVGHSWGGLLVQVLARQQPERVAGPALLDPAHEEFRPPLVRASDAVSGALLVLRRAPGARTVRAEYGLAARHAAELRRLRATRALPDVPVTVLSASRGLPRRLRTRWTRLQAGIAAGPTSGRRAVVPAPGTTSTRTGPRRSRGPSWTWSGGPGPVTRKGPAPPDRGAGPFRPRLRPRSGRGCGGRRGGAVVGSAGLSPR